MSNRAQHNRHQHNQGAFGGLYAEPVHPWQTYRIEVRTAGGALVMPVWNWSEGKSKEAANEHGDLSLTVPYSSDAWGWFAASRQVWLRDNRGRVKEKYHVTKRARSDSASGSVIKVEARSLIYQWSREIVTNYYVSNETQTVTLPSGLTAGTFTLKFRSQTTSNIAYNASAGTVQTALEALSSIGSGNVTVTGSAGGPYSVTFIGTLAETNVPKLIGNGSGLTGGSLILTADTARTKTLSETVKYLINTFQLNTTPIYYGYIDPAIGDQTVSVKFENKSLLACVLELRDLYGGYMWVDAASRRFYWKRARGRNTGQFVRIGTNGQHIEEIEDFSGLANRIIAIGAGETLETSLTVTVNDTTSQSAYGIVPDVIANKNIDDTTDLTAFANANLNARKAPKKSWRVGVIDLSLLDGNAYQFFELETGSKIRVIDNEFNIAIDTTIAAIERDLDAPLTTIGPGGGSGGSSSGGGGRQSRVRIAVTNPDAGTTAWGANEPSIIPAEERDLPVTIADIIAQLQDEAYRDTGFERSMERLMPEMFQSGAATGEAMRDGVEQVVNQLIADGDVDVPSPGSDIQSVGTANSAGSGDSYARDNHVHKGNHFSATTIGALPAMSVGNDWHTTTGTEYYGWHNTSGDDVLSHI